MSRKWLRDIRVDARKSGLEVAGAADISQQMYSLIEIGQRQPSVQVAKRIAAVLGFEWTRFFEDDPADSA